MQNEIEERQYEKEQTSLYHEDRVESFDVIFAQEETGVGCSQRTHDGQQVDVDCITHGQ